MNRLRAIWLVAKREIIERGRSRGFILSVLFTTLIVVGSILLPSILFGDDDVAKVGLVEPAPTGLDAAITATATAFDAEVEFRSYADLTAGDAALEADEVAVLVAVPPDLSSAGEIRFAEGADEGLRGIIGAAVVSLRTQAVIVESDVDTGALAAAQTPPEVVELDPPNDEEGAAFLFANIGAVLILIGIFSFGFTVLTGVVEEKQSRVVEVVLSTVRPRDLLMGKVLGIGVLGLVQMAVFVVAALLAASFVEDLPIPETTPAAVLQLVIWFILGYALYSTVLGFTGALASRMEEASNASTPVTIVAMVAYFVAIFSVVEDPSGIVATVATFIPPIAPFVVPLRSAFDAIGPIEIVLSIALTIVAIYVLFTIGARIYSGAVLQTAGRMKLRDAWRSAGDTAGR